MSIQVTRIDDQDPSITYSSSNWILGGNGNEYMGTTMRTVTLGASMKIIFTGESNIACLHGQRVITSIHPYIGTKIAVFGSLGPEIYGKAPTSLFSIDGGRAQQFIGTQADNDSLYQQKFYESPDLTPGHHILLVTISDVPSLTSAFIVDYADISNSGVTSSSSLSTPSALATSSSITLKAPTSSPSPSITSSPHSSFTLSTSGTSSPSSSLSITGRNVTGLSSPTSDSGTLIQGSSLISTDITIQTFVPQHDTVSAQSKGHTPVIVGAVVGCIVFILLLFLGHWLYLRRRKAKQPSEKVESTLHECKYFLSSLRIE